MADHLQEEEQLDAIKQWWDENRVSVIAAVVLTIGGSFGWSQYQDYTVSTADAAANAYDEVLQLKLSGESAEQLAVMSRGLRERHAGDAFANFASLQVASAAVEAGDLALAERELESVMASVDLENLIRMYLHAVQYTRDDRETAKDKLKHIGDAMAGIELEKISRHLHPKVGKPGRVRI